MQGFVATTDQNWFDYLSQRPEFDEVNFWAPSGKVSLRSLDQGAPFIFKLKSPHHAVGGFGYLGPITSVPLSIAWEAFGQKNGANDLREMTAQIVRYRTRKAREDDQHRGVYDPSVGCRTILDPVFFPRDLWVEAPRDWSMNIVQGKTYDLSVGEGQRLWRECQERRALIARESRHEIAEPGRTERWGSEQLYRPRLGQGAFRLAVTDAYGRACAVTGEHSLPVLDSAHIQPYAEGGMHEVSNGLLLRTDLHRLYDRGYVTVTPDHEFRVSEALRNEFENGRVYYDLERVASGRRRIVLPKREEEHPDRDRLAWHGEVVFRG